MNLEQLNALSDDALDLFAAETFGWPHFTKGGRLYVGDGFTATYFCPSQDHNDAAQCCKQAVDNTDKLTVGIAMLMAIDVPPMGGAMADRAAGAVVTLLASARAKTIAALLAVTDKTPT